VRHSPLNPSRYVQLTPWRTVTRLDVFARCVSPFVSFCDGILVSRTSTLVHDPVSLGSTSSETS
jgi:hypothetical protein